MSRDSQNAIKIPLELDRRPFKCCILCQPSNEVHYSRRERFVLLSNTFIDLAQRVLQQSAMTVARRYNYRSVDNTWA